MSNSQIVRLFRQKVCFLLEKIALSSCLNTSKILPCLAFLETNLSRSINRDFANY